MSTYSKTKHVHVFTKEELLEDLDKVIDSTENTIGPDQLSNLQKVREGINQIYGRIEQLCQTTANLQKVSNFYVSKVNTLSQRIKQSQEKIDPVEKALRKIEGKPITNLKNQRIKQSQEKVEKIDSVEKALRKVEENMNM